MSRLLNRILFLSLLAVSPVFAGEIDLLSVSNSIACNIDGKVNCWNVNGKEDYSWLPAPPLAIAGVTHVSAGGNHACAASNEQVQCWGSAQYENAEIPRGKNITMLVSGNGHSCYLGDDGVKCWGQRNYRDFVPGMVHPVWVSAGGGNTCAIDENRVNCWGSLNERAWISPCRIYDPRPNSPYCHGRDFSAPREVSIGDELACVIDSVGVHCYYLPSLSSGELTGTPALKDPRSVSVSGSDACALDGGQVRCWDALQGYALPVPALNHPRLVRLGYYIACALDDEGTKCWQTRARFHDDPPVIVPPVKVLRAAPAFPFFHPGQLPTYFAEISSHASPARAQFFAALGKVSSGQPGLRVSDESYMAMALGSPAVLTSDSAYFATQLIPAFEASVLTWNASRGFASVADGMGKIIFSAESASVAVRGVEAALRILAEFVPVSERSQMQDAVRALGQASANPSDLGLAREAGDRVGALISLWQKYGTARNAFLLEAMQLGANWLRKTH